MDTIYTGDALSVLKTLPDGSVQTCITSPPYFGLRDYGMDGQIGLEETPDAFVQQLVEVFREVRRVLREDGTLWLNLGDSYAANRSYQVEDNKHRKNQTNHMPMKVPVGLKQKDLIGIPWRVAFALQADGWYLRQDIIWSKPNPMPESVTDRCTKAHEYIFLLTKSSSYYFDHNSIREKSVGTDPRMVDGFVPKSINGKHKDDPQNSAHRKQYTENMSGAGSGVKNHNGYFKADGSPIGEPGMRNKRSVWSITTSPFKGAHFATFPEKLVEPMIMAGCPPDGVVLDPFFGAGTTGVVSKRLGRKYIGIELNPEYVKLAKERLATVQIPLNIYVASVT